MCNDKKIVADYGRYYEPLQELAKIPLFRTPTIQMVRASKAQLKSGYKEIKETNFDGSFIDYLCLISMRFVIYNSKKTILAEFMDYIAENWDETAEEFYNALRLIIKRPEYFYNEFGIKLNPNTDNESFNKLADLYFEIYKADLDIEYSKKADAVLSETSKEQSVQQAGLLM